MLMVLAALMWPTSCSTTPLPSPLCGSTCVPRALESSPGRITVGSFNSSHEVSAASDRRLFVFGTLPPCDRGSSSALAPKREAVDGGVLLPHHDLRIAAAAASSRPVAAKPVALAAAISTALATTGAAPATAAAPSNAAAMSIAAAPIAAISAVLAAAPLATAAAPSDAAAVSIAAALATAANSATVLRRPSIACDAATRTVFIEVLGDFMVCLLPSLCMLCIWPALRPNTYVVYLDDGRQPHGWQRNWRRYCVYSLTR